MGKVKPRDIDIVCTPNEAKVLITHLSMEPGSKVVQSSRYDKTMIRRRDNLDIELEWEDSESNQMLEKIATLTNWNFFGKPYKIPTINQLYLIKRSHLNYNINWERNLELAMMLRRYISLPNEEDKKFYEQRKKEAKERYGKSQAKIRLDVSNKKFFKQSQKLRVYDHDSLHRVVAFTIGKPIYERCKKDLDSAMIDQELFEKLDSIDKINMVVEEAMVIGLEREYIPYLEGKKTGDVPNLDDNTVFYEGLKIVASRLCKGFFQDYILDNWSLIEMQPKLRRWNCLQRFHINQNMLVRL